MLFFFDLHSLCLTIFNLLYDDTEELFKSVVSLIVGIQCSTVLNVMGTQGLCDCGKLLPLIVSELMNTTFLIWIHFLFLYGTQYGGNSVF